MLCHPAWSSQDQTEGLHSSRHLPLHTELCFNSLWTALIMQNYLHQGLARHVLFLSYDFEAIIILIKIECRPLKVSWISMQAVYATQKLNFSPCKGSSYLPSDTIALSTYCSHGQGLIKIWARRIAQDSYYMAIPGLKRSTLAF